ncbi:hypothetical protein [Enterococcus faecalis]|uniref:hypothetical protein n=1 Tax=Enterococcus faecalis TaxID=1351 RepID=UPI0022E0F276|nr:hypothetical protein [Enterococcus faecalis]
MEKMLNSNGMILINSYMFFTPEERTELKQNFEENNIELFFLEERGIKNSIFDGIEIILNNNLFNMLVGGVLMPTAYDVLKNSLVIIVKKIRNSNVKLLRANKDPEPVNAVIKVKTDAGEIIASIDQELSSEEVEKYIDALIMAHKIANNTPDNKNQYFIVDKASDGALEVLLLSEYLKRHNKL